MINLVPRVESVLTPRIYLRSQISSLRVKKVTISKTNDIFYYKKDTLLAPTDQIPAIIEGSKNDLYCSNFVPIDFPGNASRRLSLDALVKSS